MNYLQLCQTLGREAGVSGARSIPTVESQTGESARLVSWIQSSDLDIQGLYFDWRFLWREGEVAIEAGISDYNLPTDVMHLDRDKVRLDGKPIDLIEYEYWDGIADDAQGDPSRVILLPSGKIRLHPQPVKAHTLSVPHYRPPKPMQGNNDISLIPEPFHDVIWMHAMLKYGFYELAPEVVERMRSEYPTRLRALESSQLAGRSRYQLAQDPDPLVVVPE